MGGNHPPQSHRGHWWKRAEANLWKTERGRLGGDDQITYQRELAATTERRAGHHGDDRLRRAEESGAGPVKGAQHLRATIGEMIAHVDSGAERAAPAREDDHGHVVPRGDTRDDRGQLVGGVEVDDVERRAIQLETRESTLDGEMDAAHGPHGTGRRFEPPESD